MLLHYAQNSRAVRVAWLLEELNLPYTIKKYKLGDKEMREESYKKLNPLGRVPTLEDNELIISESGAIIQYIISKYGNNQFIPAKPILLTFEVTKAELTVIAEDKTINKGDIVPALTIEYRGFVNNDSVQSLKKPATARVMETGSGLFKKTRIVPSGAESPNYTFKYLTGVLKVKSKKN